MKLEEKYPAICKYRDNLLTKADRTTEEEFLLKNLEVSMENYKRNWHQLKKNHDLNDEEVRKIIEFAHNQIKERNLIYALSSKKCQFYKAVVEPTTLQMYLRMAQKDAHDANLLREMKRFERDAEHLNIAQDRCVLPDSKIVTRINDLKVKIWEKIASNKPARAFLIEKNNKNGALNYSVLGYYEILNEILKPRENISDIFGAIARIYERFVECATFQKPDVGMFLVEQEVNKAKFYKELSYKAKIAEFKLGLIDLEDEIYDASYDLSYINDPKLQERVNDLFNTMLLENNENEQGSRANIRRMFCIFEHMDKLCNEHSEEIQESLRSISEVNQKKIIYDRNFLRAVVSPELQTLFIETQKAALPLVENNRLTHILKIQEGDWEWIQKHKQKSYKKWMKILNKYEIGRLRDRDNYADFLIKRDRELHETKNSYPLNFEEKDIPMKKYFTNNPQNTTWSQYVLPKVSSDLNQKEDQPEEREKKVSSSRVKFDISNCQVKLEAQCQKTNGAAASLRANKMPQQAQTQAQPQAQTQAQPQAQPHLKA